MSAELTCLTARRKKAEKREGLTNRLLKQREPITPTTTLSDSRVGETGPASAIRLLLIPAVKIKETETRPYSPLVSWP